MTMHLAWLLAVLLAAGGAGAWGWQGGELAGKAAQAAAYNSTALTQITGVLEAHKDLVAKAGVASRQMRAAVAARVSADARSSQEFRDALKVSAVDRSVECEFSDGVMRQLSAARGRAAQAAASGIHGAVPDTAASAPRAGHE